ncbi:MAG: tetratricopeptide repeat protein [Gorillibacterium sp.]|nr:tetratricopeptide repeat protein [Gorillibacterium sp.]
MSKFILFGLLTWLTGSPFIAIIVLLLVYYYIDRRFIGIIPNLGAPFKRNRRLRELRQHLRTHLHDTTSKLEAARLLITNRKYSEAEKYLREILPIMGDSADVLYELGICRLKSGDLVEGESLMLQSLNLNPRVAYGDPYLRLGDALDKVDPEKAIHYLECFRQLNTSSCEAYYRLGQIYTRLGRETDAKSAFRETVDVYRLLPKYKRKTERKWALLAVLHR